MVYGNKIMKMNAVGYLKQKAKMEGNLKKFFYNIKNNFILDCKFINGSAQINSMQFTVMNVNYLLF